MEVNRQMLYFQQFIHMSANFCQLRAKPKLLLTSILTHPLSLLMYILAYKVFYLLCVLGRVVFIRSGVSAALRYP